MCLHFLDLLQYEHFRKEITNGQCAKFIEDQQLLHWQHYIRKRTRLLQAVAGQDGQQASSQHQQQQGSASFPPLNNSIMSANGGISNGNSFALSQIVSQQSNIGPK